MSEIDLIKLVHEQAGRTLSKDDYDLCKRIAYYAYTSRNAEVRSLEAQLAEAQRDAERYRLINDFENDDEIGALLKQTAAIIAFKYQLPIAFVTGRSISQILDAALNKTEQEKV